MVVVDSIAGAEMQPTALHGLTKQRAGPQRKNIHAFIEGPGMYRQVGDAQRKNSVLIALLNSFTVPSHYPQTEKIASIEFRSIKV